MDAITVLANPKCHLDSGEAITALPRLTFTAASPRGAAVNAGKGGNDELPQTLQQ